MFPFPGNLLFITELLLPKVSDIGFCAFININSIRISYFQCYIEKRDSNKFRNVKEV